MVISIETGGNTHCKRFIRMGAVVGSLASTLGPLVENLASSILPKLGGAVGNLVEGGLGNLLGGGSKAQTAGAVAGGGAQALIGNLSGLIPQLISSISGRLQAQSPTVGPDLEQKYGGQQGLLGVLSQLGRSAFEQTFSHPQAQDDSFYDAQDQFGQPQESGFLSTLLHILQGKLGGLVSGLPGF